MIRFNGLNVAYRKKRPILKNLNGEFAENRVHGLLGANGVGKTTLLKTICGLLLPSEGRITVGGREASKRLPSMLRDIFFVPEEFDLPPVTLDTYVKRTQCFYPEFSREAFDGHCREMEVDAGVNLQSLSMGQRKKAYLAFALACNTPYLIMDEPTNGLDIASKSVLKRLLAAQADSGATIVISTHQVADLERLIDSVTIMDAGGIVLSATTREIEQKLAFGPVAAADECLYSEETLGGPVGVTRNDGTRETGVDLALLYNAAVRNTRKLTEIMNPEQ